MARRRGEVARAAERRCLGASEDTDEGVARASLRQKKRIQAIKERRVVV